MNRDDNIIAAAINKFGGGSITSSPYAPVAVTAVQVASTRQLLQRYGYPASTRPLAWRVAREAGALEEAADMAARAAVAEIGEEK